MPSADALQRIICTIVKIIRFCFIRLPERTSRRLHRRHFDRRVNHRHVSYNPAIYCIAGKPLRSLFRHLVCFRPMRHLEIITRTDVNLCLLQDRPQQSGLHVKPVRAGGVQIHGVKPAGVGALRAIETAIVPIGRRQHIAVFRNIHIHRHHDLLEIVKICRLARRVLRLAQGGQKHRGQNGDDCNNHQKFNQGERAL